jgi:hypothetical protein
MPITHLAGECTPDRPSQRPLMPLTECRNERKPGRAVTASSVSCRRVGTTALLLLLKLLIV